MKSVSIFVLQEAILQLSQQFIGEEKNWMHFYEYILQTLLKRSCEQQRLKKEISPLNVMVKEESGSQQAPMLAISIQFERPMQKSLFSFFCFSYNI